MKSRIKNQIIFFIAVVVFFTALILRRKVIREGQPAAALNRSSSSRVQTPSAKPFVIWSNDYHISPIKDPKDLLQPLGISFIDKSLSGHCHVTNTCEGKNTLRVINRDNAMHLDHSLIPKFFESYKNDAELLSVDAFACFLPPAMCELFEPFNRSLLIIVPTRYEAGRLSADRWTRWNENLIRMSKHPRNIIAANNVYDAEYVRYFTGIRPMLLPSYCGYATDSYTPTRPGFILAPIHNGGFANLFSTWHTESCRKTNCTVELIPLRSRYPHYALSDISAHRGVVYVPYQVSVMSMFEQYRMNIPLFFPSIDLLAAWQRDHMVMNERTWEGVFGNRPTKSAIAAHPTQSHLPDPNDEHNIEAIRYWIGFSDFYQMPHIEYYNSIDELVQRLEMVTSAELEATSKLMKEYNSKSKTDLMQRWKEILRIVTLFSPN